MDGLRTRRILQLVIASVLAVGVTATVSPGQTPRRPTEPAARQPTPVRRSVHSSAPANSEPAWSRALEHHGRQRIRSAYDLASRGAIHTAENELLQVLETVALTLDTDQGTSRHTRAFSAAKAALDEAQDFMRATPPGAQPQSVAVIAAAHRTCLLQLSDGREVNPIVATQLYYSEAARQFTAAAGGQPVAAEALFALGRVLSILRDHPLERDVAAAPMYEQRMLVFYQAAWAVDPRHHRAANEFGVLLARFHQWPQACQAFEYSVAQCAEPQNTRNLAVAYDRLGERELAEQARQLHRSITADSPDRAFEAPRVAPAVEWVDPATFARSGGPSEWTSTAQDGRSETGRTDVREVLSDRVDSAGATRQSAVQLQEKPQGLIPASPLDRWKSVFRSGRPAP